VFAYKGDIYITDTDGGLARQITSNNAHDTDPLWTLDGKRIIFS
jgi:Tol biopolymer transport system component